MPSAWSLAVPKPTAARAPPGTVATSTGMLTKADSDRRTAARSRTHPASGGGATDADGDACCCCFFFALGGSWVSANASNVRPGRTNPTAVIVDTLLLLRPPSASDDAGRRAALGTGGGGRGGGA